MFESRRLFDRLVLERVLIQAIELTHPYYIDLTERMSDSWNSRSTLRMPCTIFIPWKLPSPTFLKVNFDGSIMGITGGASFVIKGLDSRPVATEGNHLSGPLVLEVELCLA